MKIVVAALLLTAFVTPGLAAWTADGAEKAFVYDGKPIHPACVSRISPVGEKKKPVDLEACHRTADGKMPVKREGKEFMAESAQQGGMRAAYSAYTVLARDGSHFLLELDESGGGTGRFSSLLVVSKKGKEISQLAVLLAGDRCNGGLSDYKMTGQALHYSVYLTPADLIDLNGPSGLKAYEDLSASAGSCVATEDREYDLPTGKERRISVTLINDGRSKDLTLQDQPGWTENYKYDHCFNAFYNGYVQRKQLVLKPGEIDIFVKDFKTACVK